MLNSGPVCSVNPPTCSMFNTKGGSCWWASCTAAPVAFVSALEDGHIDQRTGTLVVLLFESTAPTHFFARAAAAA
eukprot:3650588-Amphidinium_carterae.1